MTVPASKPPPTRQEIDALLAPLSADERQLALAEFDALPRHEVRDIGSYGCLGSFAGLVLLILLPTLARFAGIPPGARAVALAFGVALIVTGIAVRIVAPAKQVRDAEQRSRRALDTLAARDHAADPAAWYRDAAALLDGAFFSNGPWTVHTFDFDQARDRLAPALPRLTAVETLLRLERGIYPVFTDFTSPPKEPDRTAR